MSTTLEREQKIAWAKEHKATYVPNTEVVEGLARFTIVLVIGPTAVGKSYIIQKVIDSDPDRFSIAGTITTREGREGDPENYRTDMDIDTLIERIKRGEIVQYDVHERTGQIYASDLQSYQTKIVLLPALASSVAQIEKVGFPNIIKVGLLAEGESWQSHLRERRGGKDYADRLKESEDCVQWLGSQRFDIPILENEIGNTDVTVQKLISIINRESVDTLSPQITARLQLEAIAVARQEVKSIVNMSNQ